MSRQATNVTKTQYYTVWSELTSRQKKVVQVVLFTLALFIVFTWVISPLRKGMNVTISGSFKGTHLTTLLCGIVFLWIVYGIHKERSRKVFTQEDAINFLTQQIRNTLPSTHVTSGSLPRQSIAFGNLDQLADTLQVEERVVSFIDIEIVKSTQESNNLVPTPPPQEATVIAQEAPKVEEATKVALRKGSDALLSWYQLRGKKEIEQAHSEDASSFKISIEESDRLKADDTLDTLYQLTCEAMKSVDTACAHVAFSLLRWLIKKEGLSPDTLLTSHFASIREGAKRPLLEELSTYVPISIRQKVVKFLLDKGANPNGSTARGGPLYAVSDWGRNNPKRTFIGFKEPQGFEDKIIIMRLLLEKGAKGDRILSINHFLALQGNIAEFCKPDFFSPKMAASLYGTTTHCAPILSLIGESPGALYGAASVRLAEELLKQGASYYSGKAPNFVHDTIYDHIGIHNRAIKKSLKWAIPGLTLLARAALHLEGGIVEKEKERQQMIPPLIEVHLSSLSTIVTEYSALDLFCCEKPIGLEKYMNNCMDRLETLLKSVVDIDLWPQATTSVETTLSTTTA